MAQHNFETKFEEALFKKYSQCAKYLIPKEVYYKTIDDLKTAAEASTTKSHHQYYILKYVTSQSFVILRPLSSKRAAEVAFQLLDIFLLFGAPAILQSDNGSEFTAQVITELKELWPQLIMVHGKPRHPQSQGSVESHAMVYKAMFGEDPKVGLTSSSLLPEILERLQSEDDLLALYQAPIL
ncbi:KRAB-A domain-containing protein 2-like [Gigantopelta aegis]|uniref:KRAB-A domain-containing protein 2-like n=1 Tax=Gigantopelta aegis TaxID=1735272 RepID=UPI001B888BB0|nr:KRAB-A domain-containing protein 2-like [Gigantopelta aegis]